MTDRLKGCVVTFNQPFRDDDAEAVLAAIRMIKGVAHVEAAVMPTTDHMVIEMAKFQLREDLFKVLK